MKVKMKIQLTGYRPGPDGDSVAWPPAGTEIEVEDREGAKLVDAGLASVVADKDAGVEKAVVSEKSEKRGSHTKEKGE